MMKVMKKLLFIALAAIIMAACSDEKPCPLCGGEGTVSVRGVEQTCLLCLGEKTVTEKQYYDYLKALGNVGSPGPASAPQGGGAMAQCPMCSGTGVFNTGHQAMQCRECDGTGRVTRQRAAELMQALQQLDMMTGGGGFGGTSIGTPSSGGGSQGGPSSGSSVTMCRSCHGTGDCTHCRGLKVVEYYGTYGESGGYMRCPVCKGTGRCGVCHGRGEIR